MKILVWEVRTSKGFTLMELSKKSGIGKSTINNIENGKVSPTLFQLEMITFKQPLEVGSDGKLTKWSTATLEFKRGILVSGTWSNG